MKLFTSIFFALFLMITSVSVAGNYTMDSQKIDNLFDNATEISMMELQTGLMSFDAASTMAVPGESPTEITDMDKGTLGFVVLTAGYLVFGVVPLFGIHRIVMGSDIKVGLLYCVTLGGICGIVPAIDWIMLLINLINKDGAGTYENNNKFFGWQE